MQSPKYMLRILVTLLASPALAGGAVALLLAGCAKEPLPSALAPGDDLAARRPLIELDFDPVDVAEPGSPETGGEGEVLHWQGQSLIYPGTSAQLVLSPAVRLRFGPGSLSRPANVSSDLWVRQSPLGVEWVQLAFSPDMQFAAPVLLDVDYWLAGSLVDTEGAFVLWYWHGGEWVLSDLGELAITEALPPVLLIDSDSIDNGAAVIEELAARGYGGGDPALCVNDHIAAPGVRAPLNLPSGTVLGRGVTGGTAAALATGQVGDEGWFALPIVPESWAEAGPTGDGLTNYLVARADGFGRRGEFLLDKIPGVKPLQAADLHALAGGTFSAVVYDSDISINTDPLEANLQGATLGIIGFEVLAVGQASGSALPDVTIRLVELRGLHVLFELDHFSQYAIARRR